MKTFMMLITLALTGCGDMAGFPRQEGLLLGSTGKYDYPQKK